MVFLKAISLALLGTLFMLVFKWVIGKEINHLFPNIGILIGFFVIFFILFFIRSKKKKALIFIKSAILKVINNLALR